MEGILKKVVSEGYGFIVYKRIDYWFHQTAYKGDFKNLLALFVNNEGTGSPIHVNFDIDKAATRSPRAVNVEIAVVAGGGKK